ncbi:MAG: OmpA family protein, partial [Cyanobacteriota bacterium]|nr:OmpA family protein [Cyanobacteriota bacterium]
SIPVRFYFENNSSELISQDLEKKLEQVKIFLNQHPNHNLKLIGYSYSPNTNLSAKKLAVQRAKNVRGALIKQGISPSRLQATGKTSLPPGIDKNQPASLMRCVILEPVIINE